jgi:TatD DNase family protein
MLIDTHCHLNHRDFAHDREAVLARARAAGVGAMVVIGYDLPSSEAAVALAEAEPSLFAAVGVHPHEAASLDDRAVTRLVELARCPKVVAIGEIGLDFYRDLSPRAAQEAAFRRQLAVARELSLPFVVHTRGSEGEVLEVLEGEGALGVPGVLHCFSAGPQIAARAFSLGLVVGLGGILTFKNARALHQTVASLPLDRIVLETDCPYLAPHPHRGQRNEPAYVALVAAQLASLQGRATDEVARVTTANARRLFGERLSDESSWEPNGGTRCPESDIVS